MFVRAGRLVTEDDAATTDWLDSVAHLGIRRKDFDRQRNELSNRFGTRASVNDTIWGILNSLVANARDSGVLGSLYWEMARMAAEEGKDSKPYLAEGLKLQLVEYRRQGVTTVGVTNANDPFVCPACRSLDGKRFTIEQALSQMPIPTLCEAESGCRCSYLPRASR